MEREGHFATGIRKIDAGCSNCARGRDLRRIGRRANVFMGGMVYVSEEKADILGNRENVDFRKGREMICEHIHGFSELYWGDPRMLTKRIF